MRNPALASSRPSASAAAGAAEEVVTFPTIATMGLSVINKSNSGAQRYTAPRPRLQGYSHKYNSVNTGEHGNTDAAPLREKTIAYVQQTER